MKCVIIGLGSFGYNVAKTLFEKRNEVIVIDSDKEKIEKIKGFSSHAVMMDSANKENLEALGVHEADLIVVCIGPNMEASILTVLFLKELRAKRIVAMALNDDHAKILEAVGATEVIYPEKDMAIKTACKLSAPNVLEFLPLTSGINIQEITPPLNFVNKSLKELDLRSKYGIQIIAIKELVPERINFIPKADFVIKENDILIIMGEENKLSKLNN